MRDRKAAQSKFLCYVYYAKEFVANSYKQLYKIMEAGGKDMEKRLRREVPCTCRSSGCSEKRHETGERRRSARTNRKFESAVIPRER